MFRRPSATALAALLATLAAESAAAQTLEVAPGYVATKFFQSSVSANITGLATDSAGRVHVGYSNGTVGRLEDLDGDGEAEVVDVIWSGSPAFSVTGILWFGDELYMSEATSITRIVDTNDDGVLDSKFTVLSGLPMGWHQNNGLFKDHFRIYFGLGSATDHDVDPDPRSGTLMMLLPSSGFATIYANGIRNAFDGAVHPVTGDIFVGDNGPNLVPGLPDPPDEINRVRFGRNYGHPTVWGDSTDPAFEAPELLLPPHTSPCGMAFNENVGLSGYRNELVVANLAGSPSSVVRVPIVYGSTPGEIRSWYEVLAEGFSSAIDIVFDDQGALYVAQYGGTQTIWRVAQESDARIIIESAPSIGTTVDLTLEVPGAGGFLSVPAASVGLGAPISLGSKMTVWLDVFSPVFRASLSPGKAVFDYAVPTILDGQGLAKIRIHLPDDPTLIGAELFLQQMVFDPVTGEPFAVSPPQSLRILERF